MVCVCEFTLQWRHNGRDSVSNHQPHDCSLNRLFRRRSKKTSKLRVTGLCVGNSWGPVNSPHKWPVTRNMFPFDDVITWCVFCEFKLWLPVVVFCFRHCMPCCMQYHIMLDGPSSISRKCTQYYHSCSHFGFWYLYWKNKLLSTCLSRFLTTKTYV